MRALRWLQAIAHDESGATAPEYAIMASFIAAVIVGAVTAIGGYVAAMFGLLQGKF